MNVIFKAAHGSESENETIRIVKTAISVKPDLSKYTFSPKVIVDETVLPPHSHPIITLNTTDNHTPELVVSNYIHEQLHHFLDKHKDKLELSVKELQTFYKDVPVGYPNGARSTTSTYEHLILCSLEQSILRSVYSLDYAFVSLRYWQSHHYCWIYKTVESDYSKLIQIADKYGLVPAK